MDQTFRLLLFFISILSVGAPAAEKTTVEFKLTATRYVNNRKYDLNFERMNKKLKKVGLDGLPELIVVGDKPAPYQKLLMKRLDPLKALLKEDDIWTPINNGYFYEYPEICYRGKLEEVPAVIDGMMGSFLNKDQGIMAIRYGTKEEIREDAFKSEKALRAYFDGSGQDDTIEEWLEFDTKSKAVLIMSNLGPQGDGTELYATYIKPCK